MVCRYNYFISREMVYILRYFHSYSFASYERLYALKIEYPMTTPAHELFLASGKEWGL